MTHQLLRFLRRSQPARRVHPALWVPVLLSVAVLLNHFNRVHNHGLSVWKGGGMGMFATQEASGTRFVEIRLHTSTGVFLGSTAGLGPSLRAYRAEPEAARFRALCRRLGDLEWRDGGRLRKPYAGSGREPVAVAVAGGPGPAGSEELAVARVELRGWKLLVDPGSGRMRHRLMHELVYRDGPGGCHEPD